jgi:hypothetical protein
MLRILLVSMLIVNILLKTHNNAKNASIRQNIARISNKRKGPGKAAFKDILVLSTIFPQAEKNNTGVIYWTAGFFQVKKAVNPII